MALRRASMSSIMMMVVVMMISMLPYATLVDKRYDFNWRIRQHMFSDG